MSDGKYSLSCLARPIAIHYDFHGIHLASENKLIARNKTLMKIVLGLIVHCLIN